MQTYSKFVLGLCLSFFLVGCNPNPITDTSNNNNPDIDLAKLSTNEAINQDTSNKIKQTLSNYEELRSIKAVNTSKKVIIAIQVKQMKRFQLTKIKNKIKKNLEKKFPNMDIVISTDSKIILELEQLEQNIQTGSFTKEKLNKKVEQIIKLTKEET